MEARSAVNGDEIPRRRTRHTPDARTRDRRILARRVAPSWLPSLAAYGRLMVRVARESESGLHAVETAPGCASRASATMRAAQPTAETPDRRQALAVFALESADLLHRLSRTRCPHKTRIVAKYCEPYDSRLRMSRRLPEQLCSLAGVSPSRRDHAKTRVRSDSLMASCVLRLAGVSVQPNGRNTLRRWRRWRTGRRRTCAFGNDNPPALPADRSRRSRATGGRRNAARRTPPARAENWTAAVLPPFE